MMQSKMKAFTGRRLIPYAILFIAALTRLPLLTWRSFNADEGATLRFSAFPYRDLFVHMADLTLNRHSLFFFATMKAWRGLVGDSDIALRLLSALLGMLTIAIVYQIGLLTLGRTRAAAATLIFALNPLVIYQHQDARMYGPALFLIALVVWLGIRVHDVNYPKKLLYFLTIAVATTAAIYLHALAATVLPILAILLLRDFPKRLPWAETAVLALVGLGILPYFYNIFATGTQGGGSLDMASWYRSLLGSVKTLFDNQNVFTFTGNEIFFGFLLLGVVVLALLRDGKQARQYSFWLLAALFMSLYVMVSVAFFTSKPYVFTALPLSYLIAIAIFGERPTGRWPTFIPVIVLIGFFAAGQVKLWQPGNVLEDFRSAAYYVEEHATEQDAVIMHLNWYKNVLGHYLTRPLAAPFANNVHTEEEVAAGFEPYLDADVIWLVQAGLDAPSSGLPTYQGDKERLVETWLADRYPVVTEVYPAGVSVKGYALDYRLPALPDTAAPIDVSFSGAALAGYRLVNDTFATRDEWLHPPSTWIPITLYWSADEPLAADVIPTITLEDDPGGVWGGVLPRENDLRHFYPPLAWQPGELVRWDFDLVVNPDIPPGTYKLVVRLLDAQTMTPLTHEGGQDWLILQSVTMQ